MYVGIAVFSLETPDDAHAGMYAADVNITRDTCIYVTRKYLAGVISRKVIQERHLKGKSEQMRKIRLIRAGERPK